DRPLHQIGGKGLFVNGIEDQLLAGAVDLAVHSMKDLPGALADGLMICCTPAREDSRDALVVRADVRQALRDAGEPVTIESLPAGARVGTTSLRRAALTRRLNPGVEVISLRGNVPTRLRKLDEGQFDAILLAAAGLRRLGLGDRVDAALDPEVFCPAATQGILALECRAADERVRALVSPLRDVDAADMAAAERAFLARLEGGCQVPMGCLAVLDGARMRVRGVVADPSGAPYYEADLEGPRADAAALGHALAGALLDQGAREVLRALAGGE
ncbi:MAG: hydroxymethylbilane synthase, partial [Myxococcales bacterium]|nr:hydroxymethylbilane synthase [Myxococcales bacterium]